MSTSNTNEGNLVPQESRLCSRCRTVNFDGGAKEFPFRLSELDQTCHLCLCLRDLLSKKGPSTSDKWILEARIGYHIKNLGIRSFIYGPHKLFLLRFRLKGHSYFDEIVGCLAECPKSSYLPKDAVTPRLVDSKRADFDLVKDWMNDCLSSHSCAALTPTSFIPNQYVINCFTRKVVPAPHECDYAALSYVWGGDQTTFNTGNTLEAVPKTIEDAMQVTRIMGITYLWVDRYCILQDNARHKMEQIHSMHKIYSNATFTIVAAAGDSPDHGLPGVSDRHRHEQPRVHLGSRLMVSTLFNPSNMIYSSKWWTRGWTYQECMHSKRLLFFTDEQVYFQCSKTAFCESFHRSTNSGSIEPNTAFSITQEQDIWWYINQYLKRDLAFPSDILNAILSVLQRFQDDAFEESFGHVWGLPVQRKHVYQINSTQGNRYSQEGWTDAFTKALLWKLEVPATRREGFPSWSWTGWFGYQYTHGYGDFEIEPRSHLGFVEPKFMVDVPDRGIIPLEDFFTDDRNIGPPSSVLRVHATAFCLRIEPGTSRSRARTYEGEGLYTLDTEGKLIYLSSILENQFAYTGRSEAYHLGIFLNFAVRTHLPIIHISSQRNVPLGTEEVKVLLLVVERKETVFERIGVCCVPYEALLRAEKQVKTIRLG